MARAKEGHLSAHGMVAAMWNHAPPMWEKMRQEKVTPPAFTEAEMANLFAFLYSVRSLDEPGDPERGRQLLFEKRCLECHAVAGQGGRAGPDLRNWASYRNPVSWIQAMWNHAPAMQTLMRERGLPWPEFQDSDVADLIAYIRTQTSGAGRRIYLHPADAEAGGRLFREKGGVTCHASRGGRARPGHALTAAHPGTVCRPDVEPQPGDVGQHAGAEHPAPAVHQQGDGRSRRLSFRGTLLRAQRQSSARRARVRGQRVRFLPPPEREGSRAGAGLRRPPPFPPPPRGGGVGPRGRGARAAGAAA